MKPVRTDVAGPFFSPPLPRRESQATVRDGNDGVDAHDMFLCIEVHVTTICQESQIGILADMFHRIE